MIHYERKARRWNIWVTGFLVAVLFVPLPFVRFETWPGRQMLAEHIATPWSRFRVCYESFPGRETVEDVYGFTWKGRLKNENGATPQFLHPRSLGPPVLKWQNGPEINLHDAFVKGELIKVETFWQPMILWPLRMAWNIKEHFKVPVRK
jgi:hypothetical protein